MAGPHRLRDSDRRSCVSRSAADDSAADAGVRGRRRGLPYAVRPLRCGRGDLDDDRPGTRLARDRDGPRYRTCVRRQPTPGETGMASHRPHPPDRHARRRKHRRLGIPALARSRLPQRAPAQAPLVERDRHRTHRRVHHPVDRDPHRFRPHVVRLLVRQLRHAEHQFGTPRSRSGERIVNGRNLLQDRAALAAAFTHLRRRNRIATRSGTVHRSATAGPEFGRQGPDHGDVPPSVRVPFGFRGRGSCRFTTGDLRFGARPGAEGAAGQPDSVCHARRQGICLVHRPGYLGDGHRGDLLDVRTGHSADRADHRLADAVLVRIAVVGFTDPGQLPAYLPLWER